VRERAGGRFRVSARPTALERTGIERFEFVVGHDGDYQPLPGPDEARRRSFTGVPGEVYAFGVRAVDTRGVPGPWVYASGLAH
jgi:hypothetical protein